MLFHRQFRVVVFSALVAVLSCGGDVHERRVQVNASTSTTSSSTTTTMVDRAAVKLWDDTVLWNDTVRWNEAVARERAAERVRASSLVSRPAATAVSATSRITFSAAMPDELVPFFACVAVHESGGNYGAVSPSGKYRGRYQMDRTFWRTHAPDAWKHLADSGDWETAPADAQDATAVTGYHNQGPGAWSGPGGAICVEYRI